MVWLLPTFDVDGGGQYAITDGREAAQIFRRYNAIWRRQAVNNENAANNNEASSEQERIRKAEQQEQRRRQAAEMEFERLRREAELRRRRLIEEQLQRTTTTKYTRNNSSVEASATDPIGHSTPTETETASQSTLRIKRDTENDPSRHSQTERPLMHADCFDHIHWNQVHDVSVHPSEFRDNLPSFGIPLYPSLDSEELERPHDISIRQSSGLLQEMERARKARGEEQARLARELERIAAGRERQLHAEQCSLKEATQKRQSEIEADSRRIRAEMEKEGGKEVAMERDLVLPPSDLQGSLKIFFEQYDESKEESIRRFRDAQEEAERRQRQAERDAAEERRISRHSIAAINNMAAQTVVEVVHRSKLQKQLRELETKWSDRLESYREMHESVRSAWSSIMHHRGSHTIEKDHLVLLLGKLEEHACFMASESDYMKKLHAARPHSHFLTDIAVACTEVVLAAMNAVRELVNVEVNSRKSKDELFSRIRQLMDELAEAVDKIPQVYELKRRYEQQFAEGAQGPIIEEPNDDI